MFHDVSGRDEIEIFLILTFVAELFWKEALDIEVLLYSVSAHDCLWCVLRVLLLLLLLPWNCYIWIPVLNLGAYFLQASDRIWLCIFIVLPLIKFWSWIMTPKPTIFALPIQTNDFFVRILSRLNTEVSALWPGFLHHNIQLRWNWLIIAIRLYLLLLLWCLDLHRLLHPFILFNKLLDLQTLLVALLLQNAIIVQSICGHFICLFQILSIFFYLLL